MRDDAITRYHFTYLNYHPKIQSIFYKINWIERLQLDFKRVLCMRRPPWHISLSEM